MLYQNLKNNDFRKYFEGMLSDSLGCQVECQEFNYYSDPKGGIFDSNNTSFVFVCDNTTILSIYKDHEEVFTPHAPEHGPQITTLIENFNRLCNRHIKIEQLCT